MKRWLWDRPGVVFAAGALALALVFPATPAGSISLAIVAALAGVAVAQRTAMIPAWVREPGRWGSVLVVLVVILAGLSVFWDTLTVSPDWQLGDWGPQHAVLARMMPSLPGLHAPVWNHAVSTGDALELYPSVAYLVTGHLALLFGLENDLPLAFMIVATVAHLALGVLVTVLAMRVASRKIALVVGLAWLVDGGAVSHGGTVGLFRWAIFHSTFAHVFSMIAVLGIVRALRRPSLAAAITIWLATAVATASHPAALLMAAACAVGLLGVAVLASDLPPRRALVALGHLGLGVALGAIVWLPASERLLAYGQHYSNEMYTVGHLLQLIFSYAMPFTVYSLLVYVGYVGTVIGVFSRRAEVVFVAIVVFVLLAGLCDVPYLALGLTPSPETARLGVIRMMLLVRPLIYVSAAYGFAQIGGVIAGLWNAAPARQRAMAAALLGVLGVVLLRAAPVFWREESQRAYEETRVVAADADGRTELTAWARTQVAELGPSRWARALFEEDTHEQMHLTALTGLPTLHMGPLPDLLLRERIEDTSPASLARFNVRWVIAVGKSPLLGDPATEITIGTFHIREVAGWDGAFARIERGRGQVVVHRLDDRAVEIEVTGTSEPVLVALGTGYYPRWRAHHASGASEPVYALPAIAGGVLHVVSAWVAPGRTTFTVDGPLPSDGDGRGVALVALVLMIAGTVTWSRARWRVQLLRRLAVARRRVVAVVPWVIRGAVGFVLLVLAVRGCAARVLPMRAFVVGSGLRASAEVQARTFGGGDWQSCGYARLTGEYECEGIVTVSDATANLVNDAPPSWALITPAVIAEAYGPGVEVRITRSLRVAGRYWAAASTPATLSIGEAAPRDVGTAKLALDLPDATQDVRFEGTVPYPGPLKLTFVAEDAVDPPRPFLAVPPDDAPPAVRAIR